MEKKPLLFLKPSQAILTDKGGYVPIAGAVALEILNQRNHDIPNAPAIRAALTVIPLSTESTDFTELFERTTDTKGFDDFYGRVNNGLHETRSVLETMRSFPRAYGIPKNEAIHTAQLDKPYREVRKAFDKHAKWRRYIKHAPIKPLPVTAGVTSKAALVKVLENYTNPGYRPSDSECQNYAEVLMAKPEFTPEMQTLLAHRSYPITIMRGIDQIVEGEDLAYVTSPNTGLVLDVDMFSESNRTPSEKEYGLRALNTALMHSFYFTLQLKPEQLGIRDDNEWESIILPEFNKAKDLFLTPEMQVYDGDHYKPYDVLANIHYAIHSRNIQPEILREAMPRCMQFYDHFMELGRKAAAKIDPDYLQHYGHGGSRSATAPPGDLPAPPDTPPAPPDTPTTPPVAEPVPAPAPPAAVTPETTTEHELVQAAMQLREDMGPVTHFRCRLSTQKGFPIVLSFSDGMSKPRQFSIPTNAPDLEEALRLKIFLQSYILSQPGVKPLHYERLGISETPKVDVFPRGMSAPNEPILIPEGSQPAQQFYVARYTGLQFDEKGESHALRISIPLGVRGDTENGAEIARERMEWLRDHIIRMEKAGRHETIDELIYAVRQHARSTGSVWKMQGSIRLEGFDHRQEFEFPHPLHGQKTELQPCNLIYNENTPNPSWRLETGLKVSGGGFTADKNTLSISLNLHTVDETVARQRALTTLEDLRANLELHAAEAKANPDSEYGQVYWQVKRERNREGRMVERITLRDSKGNGLQGEQTIKLLLEFFEDMPQPKEEFFVAATKNSKPIEDGRLTRLLHIHNGIDKETLATPYRNDNYDVIQRSIYFAPENEKLADEFVAEVNRRFTKFVHDAYGNTTRKEVDGKEVHFRKPRQKYHPATLENKMNQCIKDALEMEEYKGHITANRLIETGTRGGSASRG